MYEMKQNRGKNSRVFEPRVSQRMRTTNAERTYIIQRRRYTRKGESFWTIRKSYVNVNEQEGRITLSGRLYGTLNNESFENVGSNLIEVKGVIEYERRNGMLIIKTMMSTPKRTGCGAILMYHLAMLAEHMHLNVGTELSALEEGTPYFYHNMGLAPSAEWKASQDFMVNEEIKMGKIKTQEEIEKRRFKLYYSCSLSGSASRVKAAAMSSFSKYWK